ncbi:MED14-domain-containing protein [Thozetella sp. PMI_491]|nr:MED14-domain-containing protein [Thozetella sp. PMI_491]
MDGVLQNGVRNDRDAPMNGVNGTTKMETSLDKGKGVASLSGGQVAMTNGASGNAMDIDIGQLTEAQHDISALPDEIQHITEDIMPLGLLLTRLAQISHNQLQGAITALAAKQVPQQLANGNSDYRSTTQEDNSAESLEKKSLLLDFAQDLHTKWVKALVITDWSKKADLVGRLIDIRHHLSGVLSSYNSNLYDIVQVKRDLHWAKVRGPDIQTALEVLSSGEADWMPDLGYIEPPPISAVDQEKWLDNLNTMLSVRLTLDEYEKIPHQFRNYRIGSGRVTFVVDDEFEVDLTIADEDFEKQFWFIDVRFLFRPAPADLSDRIRQFIEAKVNDALAADGLVGCYRYLHEFVLTHKISELYRQAIELSRNNWVGTLKVERLNRAMSIQYWANKTPAAPGQRVPGSWVIIGVDSGSNPTQPADSKTTSSLSLRWFRDHKEVKESDIPFDVKNISAEHLLKTVIARHVEYTLSSIHAKLLSKPRFSARQASLRLEISKEDPMDSVLSMQLVDREHVEVRVAPITGTFELSPQSAVMVRGAKNLDASPNPAEDGAAILEQLRGLYEIQAFNRRAKSTGWAVSKPPIKPDELKQSIKATPQDQYQQVWLKRPAWNVNWYVLATLSLEGDRWWLVEITPGNAARGTSNRVKVITRLPLDSGASDLSDAFLNSLTVFVAGIVTHYTDLRELGRNQIKHDLREPSGFSPIPGIKLPVLSVRLSALLRETSSRRRAWAKDSVTISFRGVRNVLDEQEPVQGAVVSQAYRRAPKTEFVAEARLTVADKSKFSLLKGQVDHDVQFNARTGQFVMRLKTEVGGSIVTLLASRLEALQRLVYLVEAIRQGGKGVSLQSVSLTQISFTYENGAPASTSVFSGPSQPPRRWRTMLDLRSSGQMSITLEKGNPHLRVKDILSRLIAHQLEQLPLWLQLTLPLFRALDKMDDDWEKIYLNNQGTLEYFPRDLQWIVIRYTLPGPPQQIRRRFNLDVRMRPRRGKLQWHVTRLEHEPAAKNPNDEFNRILKQKVWSNHGQGWKGLMTGAAADPHTGIEPLLGLIDSTIRAMLAVRLQPSQPTSMAANPNA